MGLLQPQGIGDVQNQPSNLNFLATHRFRLVIWRAPTVQYFTQEANLPGMAMGNATQASPFVDIPQQGDKIRYEDFTMTFPVDMNMRNYKEIATWIVALGFPSSYGQFAQIDQSQIGIKSNINLIILDAQQNPQHNIIIHDAFPYAISGINFDTKATDTQIPLVTCSFKYTSWEFDEVNNVANLPSTDADIQ